MRYFQQVGTADLGPLRMALQLRPDIWDRYPYRTAYNGTPFRGMNDILLRFSKPEMHEGKSEPQIAVENDKDALVLFPAWHELPDAHEVCFNLMRRYKGITLGRVIIARLPVGGVIAPHADNGGDYATQAGGMRFHAVVSSRPGCVFHCGNESVQMPTDTVWWFDHKAVHSVENFGDDDRIHLLIDVLTG